MPVLSTTQNLLHQTIKTNVLHFRRQISYAAENCGVDVLDFRIIADRKNNTSGVIHEPFRFEKIIITGAVFVLLYIECS